MKRVNPKSIENLQPRFAPDKPGETVTLGVRLRKDQRERLDKLSALRDVAIGVLVREAIDNYLTPASGTASENSPPPPPPGSPPLDADTLAQVLTEVLAVPRLPAAAKKKLESLLEKIRERLTK